MVDVFYHCFVLLAEKYCIGRCDARGEKNEMESFRELGIEGK